MANYGQPQPQLVATFYPGGSDDFYMPELISPSPQRLVDKGNPGKGLDTVLIERGQNNAGSPREYATEHCTP
jgi:hypothetical protein